MTGWRGFFDVPLYPIVVALALFLQLIAINGVGLWVSLRALIVVAVIGIVVSVILRLLLGDRDRAGVAAFATVVALVGGDPRLLLVALILIALLFVEGRLLRGRVRVSWPQIGRISRVFALVLCLAIVVEAFQLGGIDVITRSITNEPPLRAPRTFTGVTSPATPDIYVILLDGYARADALKQVFAVDETEFLDGLATRGLSVSSKALTNYPNTVQVLMAMFNMQLLQDIPALSTGAQRDEPRGRDSDHPPGRDGEPAVRCAPSTGLRDRRDLVRLRRGQPPRGRPIHHDRGGHERGRDRHAPPDGLRGRVEHPRAGLRESAGAESDHDQPRDAVDARGREPGPSPVHLRSRSEPHPPWVFNADGSPRTVTDIHALYADDPAQTGLTEDQLKAGYAGSVEYLHQPVLEEIDAIEREAAVPPIILVFGDHGSWVGAMPGDARLRFLPLLAARVPGNDHPLPDDETLVNVFPDLLNPVLGTTFPRVDPAPSYMFSDSGPYDLHQLDDPNGAIVSP